MKNSIKSFLFFISLGLLQADTVVTTITTGTVTTGYFNAGNTLTVVVTFEGDNRAGESSDDTDKFCTLYVGFASGSTVSSIDQAMSGKTPAVGVQTAGADNVITFSVSKAQLLAAYGGSADGLYFKFNVKVHGISTHIASTQADGGSSHRIDITNPNVSAVSYPASNGRGFNTQKIGYTLSEAVRSGSQSKVTFQGDDVDLTAHIFNFTSLGAGAHTTSISSFTSGGNLQEGARYDIKFNLMDVAGNTYSHTNWRYDNRFDQTRPTITVSSSSASSPATYKIGDSVPITLTFSESIFTNGTMNVTMDLKDATTQLVQVSNFASYGSRVSTKSFNYVVQEGNTTGSDKLGISSIAMASNNIIDVGYNATNNYTGFSTLVANSKNFTIDGVKPTITSVTTNKADATYGIGATMTLTVTFSEPVTLAGGNIIVTLETGSTDTPAATINAFSNQSTVTCVYTVVEGDGSGDLTVKTIATSGTVSDVAGNAMSNFSPTANLAASSDIVIETVRPTIANITSTTSDGTYGVGQDVNIKVTFSEAVTLSAGGKFSIPLETGNNIGDFTAEIETISAATNASDTYTIVEKHESNDLANKGNPTLSGTITDAAGNVLDSFAIPGGQRLEDLKALVIDATYPVITNASSSSSDGTFKIGDDINITLTFSENVTLASGNLELTLNTGNGNKASITSISGANSGTVDYTVVETDNTLDLDINSIALAAGATLKDGGNNQPQNWTPATTLAANKAIVIDGTRPTVSKIFSAKTADYYKIGDDIDIQVHFSEAVSTTAANILKGTLETGATNADEELTYGAIDNATSTTINYTVGENDYSAALTMKSPLVVSGGQRVNDQAGNEMTVKTIPAGQNLADLVVNIFVDGEKPVDDDTDISATAKGGNEVAGKYNSTNTSVDFVVTFAGAKLGTGTAQTDITLVGGSVQMYGKISPNGWTAIGDLYAITSNDVNTNGTATVNVLPAPIVNLTGFATGAGIDIKAKVKDRAGNALDWADRLNKLAVDITLPTVTSVTSTDNPGIYKIADDINVTLDFSENVTMYSDVLKLTMNTAAVYTLAANTISNVNTKSTTYTVAAGERTPDISGAGVATLALASIGSDAGQLRDQAGNPMALPQTVFATKISDAKAISVDGVAPTKLITGTLISTGNMVRYGYWNGVNTGVDVTVPIEKTDNTLVGGKIRIKAKKSTDGTWTYVGNWSTIASSEVSAGEKVVSITAANIAAFTGQEGNIIEFTAGVQDKAGNETEWDKSTRKLIVDTVKPLEQQVTATITSIGGTVVANTWNSTNTSVSVKVDFPTDASLENGQVVLTASEDNATFTDFADTSRVTSGIYAAKTLTVEVDNVLTDPLVGFEELPWFTEGDIVRFRAKVLDRAGNERHYTVSATTLKVKESLPTVLSVNSSNINKAYKSGQDLTIQVIASEVINVSGTPRLKLETGATDALISYASGTTTNTLSFTYSIVNPHTSLDLNYFDESSLTISASEYIRDDFGNPLTQALPDPVNAQALAGTKDLVIDTTPPSVRFTYDDPDSLVRKETGTLIITATFSDSIMVDSIPRISVDFPTKGAIGSPGENDTPTSGDQVTLDMTRSSGTVYTYNLPLVDDSDGIIKVSVVAKDKALNEIIADSTFDGNIVTIDNTNPAAFTAGKMTLFADSLAGEYLGVESLHWFNKSMDSLRVVLPVDITDFSLLRGNVQIQMQVDGKMASNDWATILPKDTVSALGGAIPKFRTKLEVLDILTPKKLAQGDTVRIRALLNDQVGNVTESSQSESFFILDTIPPSIRPFYADTIFTASDGAKSILTVNRDKQYSNDTLRFAYSSWPDSVYGTANSGLDHYEYFVYQSTKSNPIDNKPGDWSVWRAWRSVNNDGSLGAKSDIDTLITHGLTAHPGADSLEHNYKYYIALLAVDSAGNKSDTLNSSRVFRYNQEPNIVAIGDTTVNEDIEWKRLIKINDFDLDTKKFDKFTYELITMTVDTVTKDSTLIENLDAKPDPGGAAFKAAIDNFGELTFTPSPLDSTEKDELYLFRIVATDAWVMDDTFDVNVKVLAVNDNPVINLKGDVALGIPAYSFYNNWGYVEGDTSKKINLTRYVKDEDNETLDLVFSYKIISPTQTVPTYPRVKLGFLSPVSKQHKKIYLNELIDDYPNSTIVQKNNAFLVYDSGVTTFVDPVRVDTTSVFEGASTDSTYAWILPTSITDQNYYTSDSMKVEFTVKDPGKLTASQSIPFFINPINDKPTWDGVPDTVIKENENYIFDISKYLNDDDDTTLTVSIAPIYETNKNVFISHNRVKRETEDASGNKLIAINDTVRYTSNGVNDKIIFKPDTSWYNSNPNSTSPWATLKKDSLYVKVTAIDDSGGVALDTFAIKIQRVPRPEIRMYVVQNNAFTNYYEIFLIDSVGKTKDLTLKINNITIELDTAAAYTYVGNHYIRETSSKSRTFDIQAIGVVGDTTLPGLDITFALAKAYQDWSAYSPDGRFGIKARNGAVDFDQVIMVIDSTMFDPYFNDRASYLLGAETGRFNKTVQVSLAGGDNGLAIYQRSTGVGWEELPSYSEGGNIMAYSNKMGYFKYGPKTLLVPGQTSLHQNYPNPFNPSTTIEYDLGFVDGPSQKVTVMIYDIMGRNIKTLINDQQRIGRYKARWNGKDQSDVPVSSGIYFVHLLTNSGYRQTKKIMLMR